LVPLTDKRAQIFFLSTIHNLRPNLSAALQNSRNDRLTFWPTPPLNLAGLHIGVHVSRRPADERFIDFNIA
jgi:hypothetical protein